ncbi:electron transfer flavoprotein subunit alpha/FixB family protein [Enterococcus faecium]|uniref:electron transfer flavoprotein subunit alpha/FixB family protein n=1 Tax=Enterococcus faecium TaxID=1352 RepID=UPI000A35B42F|nr:electron transfer flavoprotein subunit alpha/FixB family protein [Enterococcus faecium]OTN91601.1 hypothetical protein A5809_000966 [Enterococcus faecium]
MNKTELWVFIEVVNNIISEVSLQILSKAREMAKDSRLVAVILGDLDEKLVDNLMIYGPNEVAFLNNENKEVDLSHNNVIAATILAKFAEDRKPNSFLFGATTLGRAVAPRVQAKLQTGLTADCLDLRFEDEILVQIKPSYGDNIMCEIICPVGRPQMATIRPDVFQKNAGDYDRPKITIWKTDNLPQVAGLKVIETALIEQTNGHNIATANKIIGLGRGASNPETISTASEVADKLGAKIGVTRPLIEMDGFTVEDQIGQSGHTVKPEFIINFGIQGATQYVSGIEQSKMIISINNDKDAPIFAVSDYGYVGDANQFIRELNTQL